MMSIGFGLLQLVLWSWLGIWLTLEAQKLTLTTWRNKLERLLERVILMSRA